MICYVTFYQALLEFTFTPDLLHNGVVLEKINKFCLSRWLSSQNFSQKGMLGHGLC
jgi:hypothetical protein